MFLSVPPERLGRDDEDAVLAERVRTAHPYAWQVITRLVAELRDGGADLACNRVPPPDEAARGQLLRVLASDDLRAALQRHFGIRLAFQACSRVAVFRPEAGRAYAEFVTPRAQVLNQRPGLAEC